MLERHYAPRATLEISACGERRSRELLAAGQHVGLLSVSVPDGERLPSGALEFVQMPPDVAGYAARLYAELHRLDDLGVSHIVVDAVPETEEWDAVRDRLSRAATAV